jgi:hypothetical protein
MRDQVNDLAVLGAPDVSPLVERDLAVQFADKRWSEKIYGPDDPGIVAFILPDMLATMTWLLKPALIAALEKEIDAVADDAAALTPEQRQVKVAELMRDILSIEREESALVWRAQAQGLPCEHRKDISPLALLGLRLVTKPDQPRPSGSSIQHAWTT